MTTTNTYNRQATKQDYAALHNLNLIFLNYLKLIFLYTSKRLGITLGGQIDQVTRFKDILTERIKLTYGELNMTFFG